MFVLSFDIGIKNLAYCLLEESGEDATIRGWKVCDIGASTYEKQCAKLIGELDLVMETLSTSTEGRDVAVVIERQPSRNPKMRVISGEVYMYFMLHRNTVPEKRRYFYENVSICKVVYFSPKFKLKVYNAKEGDDPIVEKKYKSQYTYRKNLAKQHCERIMKRDIERNKEWIELYNSSKKKDDLCDSMLQGLAWLTFK